MFRCALRAGFLAVLVWCGVAQASGSGVVSGKVFDAKTGAVVAWANVVLEGTELGAATDGCGCYEVPAVPPGTYAVTASAIGYASETRNVSVNAGRVATVDFRLSPQAIEQSPVEVQAAAPEKLLGDRPGATEVVTSREIKAKGAATLQDALKGETGLKVSSCCPSTSAAEVQIQGLSGKYTQVAVDGLPTVSELGCCYGLPYMAAENIERVEVTKGPGSLQYGTDAFGGVVNVVTRSLARTGGTVTAEAGGCGTVNVNAVVGAKVEELDATVTLSKNRTAASDVNGDRVSDYAQSDRASFSAKLSREFAPGLALSLGTSYWTDERHGGSLERIAGRAQEGVYENPNLTSWNPVLSADWQPSDATRLGLRGSYSDYRQRVFADESWFTAYEQTAYGEAQLVQSLPLNQRLTATLSNRYQALVENTALGTKTQNNTGLVAEDELDLGRVGLAARMRLDRHSALGLRATPSGSVVLRPGRDLTVRATFGAGYKAPPMFTKLTHFCPDNGLFEVVQNPDLRPEQSRGGNLSAEYRRPDVSLAAVLFRTDITDMIADSLRARDTASGVWQYQHVNRGAVATQGAELSASVKPVRGLSVRAGYSLLDTRDQETGSALPYRSRHSGSLQLGYSFSRLGLDLVLGGEFVGSMGTQRRQGDELVPGPNSPNYTLWNSRVNQKLGRNLEAFLAVNNAFGFVQTDWFEEDVPLWGPSRGRHAMAGIRLNF